MYNSLYSSVSLCHYEIEQRNPVGTNGKHLCVCHIEIGTVHLRQTVSTTGMAGVAQKSAELLLR